MKLKEIVSYIESIAPLAYQEDYDNAGLIVGNSEMELSGALITVDATEEIIDEAIKVLTILYAATSNPTYLTEGQALLDKNTKEKMQQKLNLIFN